MALPGSHVGPMTRDISSELTFLSGAASTVAGTFASVADYRHLIIHILTDGGGTADLTVKCRGCAVFAPPADWTAAKSLTNIYENVGMYDYQNAEITIGNTGFTVAGGDDYRLFMVDVDALMFVNFVVTAHAAGSVTVKGYAFSN